MKVLRLITLPAMIESPETRIKSRVLKLLKSIFLVYASGIVMLVPVPDTFTGPSPMSMAWAQTVGCDVDGDGFIIDSNKCKKKNKGFPIDCDDSDPLKNVPEDCAIDSGSNEGAVKCYVEDTEDTAGTVPSTVLGDGLGFYTDGLDIVNCGIGDVVSDNLSPIRFRTLQGGSITNAIRFLDLDFFGKCTDVEAGGCDALPENFFDPSLLDTTQLSTRASSETFAGHIYEMEPGEPAMTGPIYIDVQGYVERYAIQMRGVPEAQHSTLCLNIEDFDLVAGGDPYYGINIYAWHDGNDEDDYPDGYTISTGDISDDELSTASGQPTVTASSGPVKRALVCSNIGPNGEPCEKRKQRNALCHTLGMVDIHFTMHVVIP